MGGYGGPKLPKSLLDQVSNGRVGKNRRDLSRKDRRKQERADQKSLRSRPRFQQRSIHQEESDDDIEDEPSPPPKKVAKEPVKEAKPAKSILKKETAPVAKEVVEKAPAIPKSVKRKLEDDDDEIAALEKKLGLNKKKKKKTGDEELDWLVFGSDDEEIGGSGGKTAEDDDWLRNKRRRSTQQGDRSEEDDDDDDDEDDDVEGLEEDDGEDDGLEDLENPFSEDELSENDFGEDDFEGFDEEGDGVPDPPAKKKENPYVAPVSQDAPVAKYVPPSMRKAASSDEEILKQLRRQVQGQLNRLSEANILSILQAVQDFSANNARQHVTSTLIDLLKSLVCDPAVLNDTFLILHAAFSTALYRVLGTDFGAQLLESLVEAFDEHHRNLSSDQSQGKQSLNLLAFLSYLYVLNAISSDIIFDYVKMLLDKENFSETNTELLLRVIRIAGTQLRQDDPSALKDIVLLLQKTITAIGENNISVRTKFMIETIHNLKNNRMKTGVAASAMSAEHLQRMKKTLGTIKTVKTTEALHITLADIRDSEKKGKWWLVGASWRDPAKMASNNHIQTKVPAKEREAEASDDDDGEVDLDKVARAQGMNTDVRRAIFVSIAGAVDYQHAHMRIMKLNLKNKQQLEIPRVLLHCVSAEPVYNHYYTLVATQFCADHKLRKAWQFALLDVFRRLEASDDDDEESAGDELTVPKIFNIAKMYAALVAEGLLRITILKPVDFGDVSAKMGVFLKTLLSTLFTVLRKKAHKDGYEKAVKDAFAQAHAVPEMVKGLQYYITTVVPAAELAKDKKEAKIIERGCDYAAEALTETAGRVAVEEEYSDED